jgi:hypothetical protein
MVICRHAIDKYRAFDPKQQQHHMCRLFGTGWGNPLCPRLAQLRILKQGKRNNLNGSSVTGDKRGRSACVSGCLVGSEMPSLVFVYRRHQVAAREREILYFFVSCLCLISS